MRSRSIEENIMHVLRTGSNADPVAVPDTQGLEPHGFVPTCVRESCLAGSHCQFTRAQGCMWTLTFNISSKRNECDVWSI